MRRFYDAFTDQRHQVLTVFRQFDENHLGLLTPFEFGRAMRQFAHVTDFVVSDVDINVLTEYFFPEGARGCAAPPPLSTSGATGAAERRTG